MFESILWARPAVMVVSIVLGVTACGGGGGGGPASGSNGPPPPLEEIQTFQELSGVHMFLSPLVAYTAFSEIIGIEQKEGIGSLEYDDARGLFNLDLSHQTGSTGGPLPETFGQGTLLSGRSSNLFSVYATSDAELAFLEPGTAGSGYDYTALALVLDNHLGNNSGTTGDYAYEALVFGFQDTASNMPLSGSAVYEGALTGNANFANGDLGSVNAPAVINVDFGASSISGRFGGMTSANLGGNLIFQSYLTGQTWSLPDIKFDIALASNAFRGSISFDGTSPLIVTPGVYTNPGGTVVGQFFGPSGAGGAPEMGGTVQVNNSDFAMNAAFVAEQGGTAASFNFDGVMPTLYTLADFHTISGTGSAAPGIDGDAFRWELITLQSLLFYKPVQHFYLGGSPQRLGSVSNTYDFSANYRADLSNSNLLTFDTISYASQGKPWPGLLSLDTADADRFGLSEVRFGLHSVLGLTNIGQVLPFPDGAFASTHYDLLYFTFGQPEFAANLPRTGVASFDGQAMGQYRLHSAFESGAYLGVRNFDFLADVQINIDFSNGDVATIFSGYDIPLELNNYIQPTDVQGFAMNTTFDGSMNAFSETLGSYNPHYLDGQIYVTSGGALEVGGTFGYTFAGQTSQGDPDWLEVTGAYGAALTTLTPNGSPPRQPTGFALALGGELLNATSGFANVPSGSFLDHALAGTGLYKNIGMLSSWHSIKLNGLIGGGQGNYGVVSDIGGDLELTIFASSIFDEGIQSYNITAADAVGATSNDAFSFITKQTDTGGDLIFALSNPGTGDFGLDYASLGMWVLEEPSGGVMVGGFAFGEQTSGGSMPATGSAQYKGSTTALAANANGAGGALSGDATVDVEFAASTVSLTLDALEYFPTGSTQTYSVPAISGTGTISGNEFFGQSGVSMRFNGTFFGPASPYPAEVAGVWQDRIINPLDTSETLNVSGIFAGQ